MKLTSGDSGVIIINFIFLNCASQYLSDLMITDVTNKHIVSERLKSCWFLYAFLVNSRP